MEVRKIIEEFLTTDQEELIEKFCEISEIRHYKKKENIYRIGEAQTKLYIHLAGAVQIYFVDETQAEITDCFVTKRGTSVNSHDILKGVPEPSVFGTRALMDTEMLEIPVEEFFHLLNQYPELMKVCVLFMWGAIEFHDEINRARLYMKGKDRYCWFREKWKEIDEVASNQQIATFLGIKSESLSRLRREISN